MIIWQNEVYYIYKHSYMPIFILLSLYMKPYFYTWHIDIWKHAVDATKDTNINIIRPQNQVVHGHLLILVDILWNQKPWHVLDDVVIY